MFTNNKNERRNWLIIKCDNCYYNDVCKNKNEDLCDDFYFIGEYEYENDLIKERKYCFRGEWFTYIEEFYN